MNIFWKFTAETLRKNKVRTLVTILGVILSVSMITAVTTFTASLQSFFVQRTVAEEGDWQAMILETDRETAGRIAADERVSDATAMEALGFGKCEGAAEGSAAASLYLLGFQQDTYDHVPLKPTQGRLPQQEGEILVSRGFCMSYSYSLGDTMALALGDLVGENGKVSPAAANGFLSDDGSTHTFRDRDEDERSLQVRETREYTIVGICDAMFLDYFYPQMNVAVTKASGDPGRAVTTAVTLSDPKEIYEFADQHAAGQEWRIFHSNLLRYMGYVNNDSFYRVLYNLCAILIGLIMAGSICSIYNAFSISITDRTRQLGLLSSLGATRKQIKKSVYFEVFVISAIGIPLGLLAGIAGIGVALIWVGKSLAASFYGTFDSRASEINMELVLSKEALLIAALLGVATVCISAWIPLRRARKMTEIEAIRQSRDIRIRPGEVKTGRLVYRLFRLEGALADKNYKRDRRKYRVTIFSLIMSMVLFNGACAFGFYLTGNIDQLWEPVADIRFYYAGTEQAGAQSEADAQENSSSQSLSQQMEGSPNQFSNRQTGQESEQNGELEEIYRLLREGETVTKSAIIRVATLQVEADEAVFYENVAGMEDSDSASVALKGYVLPDEVFMEYAKTVHVDGQKLCNSGFGGIVYDNVLTYNPETRRYEPWPWFRQKRELSLRLLPEWGEGISLTVVGFAEDVPYGIAARQSVACLVIPGSAWERLAQAVPGLSCQGSLYFDASRPDQAYEWMLQQLKDQGYYTRGELYNNAWNNEARKNIAFAVNVLSYGFVILISLIATANVFNTVSTGMLLRRREFAVLRSIGLSQRGLRKMAAYECLCYGFRAVAIGFPLSVLVAWALNRSIAEGVEIGFLIPWQGLMISVGSVFLVVFASVFYAMVKIRKDNLVEVLRQENF